MGVPLLSSDAKAKEDPSKPCATWGIPRAQRNPCRNMTYIESPVETITRFIPSWRNTSPNRLAQEIVSSFNETHRKPDEFRYKYKEDGLVDYQTEEEVNIDRSTYLGQKDAEFFDTLTSWVSENDSGVALWISPSYESAYPSNKITIYTIEKSLNGEKNTFNVSILFDAPKEYPLQIAAKLNSAFVKIDDPEVLRNKLFTMDESFTLVSLLELISANQYFPPTPSIETINYFVKEIHSGRSPRSIAEEMYKNGIIGEHSVSCAGTGATSILESGSLVLNFGGAEDQYGSLYFSCPKCGVTNMRPFGQLISHCQHCGGDVSC